MAQPTHLQGNILDHVYVSEELKDMTKTSLYYTYFSDHDAVMIKVGPNDCQLEESGHLPSL